MSDVWLRLRALIWRRRVEAELDEELAFHIEMQTRKHVASGMSDAEARRRARVQFGAPELVKDECRDERRISLIETIFQDVRYSLRGCRRTPAFSLTVILTIALGLGVNTAAFTIFNAYVLRPFAVHDPYSLYEVAWVNQSGRGISLTPREYDRFREQNPAFSEVFGYRNLQLRINGHQTFGELVTSNYFRTLGSNAALGRTLVPEDAAVPGREPVVVLSYGAWQRMFGADPEILGKKILVGGYPLQVVGVTQEEFTGLDEVPTDFWTPVTMSAQLDPDRPAQLRAFGRLKRSVSVGQAEAALSVAAQSILNERPNAEKDTHAQLQSRATNLRMSKQALLLMSPIVVAFFMVLLIACANVANMMLARAMARQREIGIRLSLGAARGRLIRQLLTESIVLAVPAALAGFVISEAVIGAGVRLMFATLPSEFAEFIRILPLAPDARVFGFVMAAAICAAILFGLTPAIQATRTSVIEAARGDFSSEYRPARLRNALVVAQVAGCVALLICSVVLLRGSERISSLQTHMRTRDVIEIEVQDRSRAKVLARLASEPVVQMVGGSAEVPLDGGFPGVQVSDAGNPQAFVSSYNHVSPEFFTIFEIPISRGRNFTREEAISGAPTAIVSDALARRLWPGGEAIGQSVRLARDPRSHRTGRRRFDTARVVGVAGDIVTGMTDDETQRSCIYFPSAPSDAGNALVVRVKGDAEAARQRIDTVITAADPGAINYIHKMQEFVAGRNYPLRMAYWISSVVAGLALALTIAGIYGVLSYLVTQRTKEFGIRMAMGASEWNVVGLVLRNSVRLAVMGLGIGTTIALGLSHLLASQLVMINAFDLLAYAGAVVLVFASCIGATVFPSRRAARMDPIATLRYE